METISFTVLGPLGISDGTQAVTLPPSKPATLLAMLLLNVNRTVSAAALQRAMWGDYPPDSARASLHTCVVRLRRILATYGISRGAIQAVPAGYRIVADAAAVDLVRFRDLVRAGDVAGEPRRELALLRSAVALWQQPILENVESNLVHLSEVPRLHHEWLRAMERIFDIELAIGRSAVIVAEVMSAAYDHPLHERFWEQLIEALYRIGRRAEALAQYQMIKGRLSEEIGIDPGPALQRLELGILRGECAADQFPSGPGPEGTASERAVSERAASAAVVLRHLAEAGLVHLDSEGQYRMDDMLTAFTFQHMTGDR